MFSAKELITVFGSAHIDTIADVKGGYLDCKGPILHSVGGGGYNVAANIAIHNRSDNREVQLFTYLPKDSLLTPIVMDKIRKCGISTKYVHSRTSIGGKSVFQGGFVALRDSDTETIIQAATNTPLDEINWAHNKKSSRVLRRSVKLSSAIVVDTNLSEATIRQLAKYCDDYNTPMFVMLVSDYKALRYSSLENASDKFCFGVSGKWYEIKRILETGNFSEKSLNALENSIKEGRTPVFDGIAPADVCSCVKTKHVVIPTKRCFFLFSNTPENGSVMRIKAPRKVLDKEYAGNTTGLTDATFSGFIHALLDMQNGRREFKNCGIDFHNEGNREFIESKIYDYIHTVVEATGATPNALISLNESHFQDLRPWWRRVGERIVHDLVQNWLSFITGGVITYVFTKMFDF